MSLFEAVAANDFEAAKRLIESGEDVNAIGAGNTTPLIEAAKAGRTELVELLLEGGAVTFIKDDEQETAMLKAAANGHVEVCRLLYTQAEEEERQMATAFLAAHGKTHGPPREVVPGKLKKTIATLGARAAKFVGHERFQERVDRVERSEDLEKKR